MDASGKYATERVIGREVAEVATELRLIDANLLLGLILGGKESLIADLVNSATEMFFEPGALRYALSARCEVVWDAPPIVGLDMEFHYDHVTAYFLLSIGGRRGGVELTHASVDGCPAPAGSFIRCLENAMGKARKRHTDVCVSDRSPDEA